MAPRVGDIVNYFNPTYEGLGPNGAGPYPMIVTRVLADGRLDGEVFPSRSPVGGPILAVPGGPDDRRNDWWTSRETDPVAERDLTHG